MQLFPTAVKFVAGSISAAEGNDSMRFGLQHTYFALPSRFYARVRPSSVADPRLVVFNAPLSDELGLDRAVSDSAALLFSGNQLPQDAEPIAMAYAGHQFGGFVPPKMFDD